MDFYEFTLYMIFANFLKMAIPIMVIFSKIFENRMKGGLVKVEEFTLVMIYVIFPQKWQFRLKNESFEISRNSAYLYIMAHVAYMNTYLDPYRRFGTSSWASANWIGGTSWPISLVILYHCHFIVNHLLLGYWCKLSIFIRLNYSVNFSFTYVTYV